MSWTKSYIYVRSFMEYLSVLGLDRGFMVKYKGRSPRICTAVCRYNFFSERHKIEGLELVLYRISIENNKRNILSCSKRGFWHFLEDFTLPDVPRDGWIFLDYDENIKKKLDGVGPVDNRPSTGKLHQFVRRKKKRRRKKLWHVTRDKWHVTHDMFVGGEHSLKISAP